VQEFQGFPGPQHVLVMYAGAVVPFRTELSAVTLQIEAISSGVQIHVASEARKLVGGATTSARWSRSGQRRFLRW
jgi:hypothetical protein